VVAALFSVALLGELPQAYHALAFALIVTGIVVSSRRWLPLQPRLRHRSRSERATMPDWLAPCGVAIPLCPNKE